MIPLLAAMCENGCTFGDGIAVLAVCGAVAFIVGVTER